MLSAKQLTVSTTDLCRKVAQVRYLSEDERGNRIRGIALICIIFYHDPLVHHWFMFILVLVLHWLEMNTKPVTIWSPYDT